MSMMGKKESDLYTKESKRITKRPSYADVYKLGTFIAANKDDIEAGKYTAVELAAMATAEFNGFTYTDGQVRHACKMAGVKFKTKWTATGKPAGRRDRRTICGLRDRITAIESRIAALESKNANVMQQLGIVD